MKKTIILTSSILTVGLFLLRLTYISAQQERRVPQEIDPRIEPGRIIRPGPSQNTQLQDEQTRNLSAEGYENDLNITPLDNNTAAIAFFRSATPTRYIPCRYIIINANGSYERPVADCPQGLDAGAYYDVAPKAIQLTNGNLLIMNHTRYAVITREGTVLKPASPLSIYTRHPINMSDLELVRMGDGNVLMPFNSLESPGMFFFKFDAQGTEVSCGTASNENCHLLGFAATGKLIFRRMGDGNFIAVYQRGTGLATTLEYTVFSNVDLHEIRSGQLLNQRPDDYAMDIRPTPDSSAFVTYSLTGPVTYAQYNIIDQSGNITKTNRFDIQGSQAWSATALANGTAYINRVWVDRNRNQQGLYGSLINPDTNTQSTLHSFYPGQFASFRSMRLSNGKILFFFYDLINNKSKYTIFQPNPY